MAEKRVPRPPAVTSACLFVGVSSALLLVYVVGWLTSWNSLDMQEAHRDIADALGVADPDRVADVLRILLLVLVVVLVAGAVGAIYASRGDRASRVLVTVVAALTSVAFVSTGGLIGVIPATFAVVAIVQLWGIDARRWFAVVNGLQPPARAAAVPPPPQAQAQRQPVHQPPAPQQWSPPPPVDPDRSPSSVRTAALVTAIASAAALGGGALYLLMYALIPRDDLVQAQLDSPFSSMVEISEAEIRQALTTSATMSVVAVILSVAALGVSLALVRRAAWAQTALFVLSVVTIIIGVLSLIGIPWAAAAVWVLVLLRRPDLRRWLSERPPS